MFITRLIHSYTIIQIILRLSTVLTLHTCLDENSKAVDWFVIYKIPEIKKHENPLIKEGLAYAYITSESKQEWILSDKSVNDSTSMLAITLASLYRSTNNIHSQDELYILYNDQPPDGKTVEIGGHSKGFVIAGSTGGFWLVHSVPHFPPSPSKEWYSYPHTGRKNGQSFLCMTASSDHIDVVGSLLMYNYPYIYASRSPPSLESDYPLLTEAARGKDIRSPPWNHSDQLVSTNGTVFQAFAKAPHFHKDLYSDWVANALEVSLWVETWPNGPGRLNSSCHQHYKAENVDSIKMSVVQKSFPSHKDHSKWAVSESKHNPWVCIGDINRAESQEHRGGGTVCLKDPDLWNAYHSSVASVENCPKEPDLFYCKKRNSEVIMV